MYRKSVALLLASLFLLSGCAGPPGQQKASEDQEMTTGYTGNIATGESAYMETTENVIYLAGGCFWGIEQLMQSIPGVLDARSGYANGSGEADANYATVSTGQTGFRETVRVEYDPDQVSLDALLLAYFYVVDPTVQNQQGNDRGSQYQTGVYYTNDKARQTVERIAGIERGRSKQFFVEIGPLVNFYPAEEYHQDYLEKNPGGLLPYSAAGNGVVFQAAHRSRRLSETGGRDHTGQADGRAIPHYPGKRHGTAFHQ